jgi:rod shape-determining protein MreC
MFKKSNYVTLGAVLLLTLVALNMPNRVTTRLKMAVGGLFLPLFGVANSSQQFAAQGADALVPRGELLRQNENFRHENQQLRIALLQAAETAQENDRLRQLLAWQTRAPWKLRLAHVVLRDPANWWRTVEIDLGRRDGLRENLPVLTADGLVGRVATVGLTRSQVILLGDPACRVSTLVENEAHDNGVILAAASPFDSSLLNLGYISRNAVLTPGQDVVTSGLGGIYPRGIPVGKIADSRSVEFGLYTEARVKLAANLGSLDEVWVMFP